MATNPPPPLITVVVGNPKARSRTLDAARATGDAIVAAVGWGGEGTTQVIDLAEVAAELFDWGSDAVRAQVESLKSARLAVVASPVYKASYSGLLKAFLDRIGQGELDEVVVVPLMIGGAANHALAVELHLRPLLVELGAILPTRGLFLLESELGESADRIDAWLAAESHVARLRRALGVAG